MGEKAGLVKRLYRHIKPSSRWVYRKSTYDKKRIVLYLLDLFHSFEKKNFGKTNDTRLTAFLDVADDLEKFERCVAMKGRWKKIFQMSAHLANQDGAYMKRLVLLINLFGMNDYLFVPNYCERDMIISQMKQQKLFRLAKDYYAYTEYLYSKRERKGEKRNVGTLSEVCSEI